MSEQSVEKDLCPHGGDGSRFCPDCMTDEQRRSAEKDALPDTYPDCGCQPDDCPDREGVERAGIEITTSEGTAGYHFDPKVEIPRSPIPPGEHPPT